MKKLINIAGVYGLAALIFGVIYRELTRYTEYEGATSLSFVHVHLMVTGTFLFLILALFASSTNIVADKKFKRFCVIYNVAFPAMVAMLFARGILQVLEVNVSKALDASVSGIAGLSHIGMAIALGYLFFALKSVAKDHQKQSNR